MKLSGNVHYLEGAGALIQFSRTQIGADSDVGKVSIETAPNLNSGVEIFRWGRNNDLPQLREELIADNNIVPTLIARKRDIVCGNSVYAYINVLRDGVLEQEEVEMRPGARDFFQENDIHALLYDAAGDLLKHGIFFPEYIRSAGTNNIVSLRVIEAKYMRAGRKDASGQVRRWYWSGHWRRKSGDKADEKMILPVDAYDPERIQDKFVAPIGDYMLNDGYYPIPTWWGGWEWIELANAIPKFHRANLRNGYSVRWHITVPGDYFLDYERYNACLTDEDRNECLTTARQREQNFMDDVNKFLSDVDNAGRALFTKSEYDRTLGKEYPGITITPLNYDMKDQALLALFEKSNTANISAQGIHPTLANIETQGRLSSGTEIRNAFLMYLITSTPPVRRKLFQMIDMVKRINGWPADVHFAIRDFNLAPLSQAPTGVQQSETVIAAQ